MSKNNFILRSMIAIVISLTGVAFFLSCNEEDKAPDIITMKVSEKTLYHDDEFQIEATSNGEISYVSENEYHATVSDEGLVTAKFIGETNILLSNGEDLKKFKVVVKPKNNLYPEPDVDFGASKATIIAKFGTPDSETSTAIGYANYSNAAPILMFLFDSSNIVEGYSVMVKSTYSSSLSTFLLERYKAVTEIDGMYMFINALDTDTATKIIGLSLYNISYWQVLYMPYSKSKSPQMKSMRSQTSIDEFKELLEQMK